MGLRSVIERNSESESGKNVIFRWGTEEGDDGETVHLRIVEATN